MRRIPTTPEPATPLQRVIAAVREQERWRRAFPLAMVSNEQLADFHHRIANELNVVADSHLQLVKEVAVLREASEQALNVLGGNEPNDGGYEDHINAILRAALAAYESEVPSA